MAGSFVLVKAFLAEKPTEIRMMRVEVASEPRIDGLEGPQSPKYSTLVSKLAETFTFPPHLLLGIWYTDREGDLITLHDDQSIDTAFVCLGKGERLKVRFRLAEERKVSVTTNPVAEEKGNLIVFWDYENISIPSGYSVKTGYQVLRSFCESRGSKVSFEVYFDAKQPCYQPALKLESEPNVRILTPYLHQRKKKRENATDFELGRGLYERLFRVGETTDQYFSTVVVITGDADLQSLLKQVKEADPKRRWILLHNLQAKESFVKDSTWNETFLFSKLFEGVKRDKPTTLNPNATSWTFPKVSPELKREPCRYFRSAAGCPFGNSCEYSH